LRKLVDTNVLLRFLTNDDPRKAQKCEALFRAAAQGDVTLHVTDVCVAELVWTLDSYYRLGREEIAEKLIALLNTPGFEFSSVRILIDSTERFRRENVDYIDAYHASVAAAMAVDVCSYDRDFDRFGDIRRVEP
jgi:uncharacterized protein